MRDFGQVAVRVEGVILVPWGAGDHPSLRVDDKGLSGKMVDLLPADPIDQGRKIPVLESGALEFGLENSLGPFAEGPRLRHDNDLRPLAGQPAHVFRKVAGVADSHAAPSTPGFKTGRAP